MSFEQKFYESLNQIFIGDAIQKGMSSSGVVNLSKLKTLHFKSILDCLKKDIENILVEFPNYREEFFESIYSFFKRYFSKTGSIYFRHTPFYQNIYEKVYTNNEDTSLFWKTHMLYYIKTERRYKSMNFVVDKFSFVFRISKPNAEEELFKYLKFELDEIKSDKIITFNVKYVKKSEGIKWKDLTEKINENDLEIDQILLKRVFSIFKQQIDLDYFINKNAQKFLEEQLNLWLFQYTILSDTKWSETRIKQLQSLREISLKLISFLAQFEDELVKIWQKPKFVLNSNYVITLNKIAKKNLELVQKIISHDYIEEQITEWKSLEIIKNDLQVTDILIAKGPNYELNERYIYLPVDTKYFPDLKEEILNCFESLDDALDGWLIKSENWQALNTIMPKFKNKIQTIYLDPPFNTGTDFDYIDKFQDATWLTLMENRLLLTKDLLSEEGNIFLHLDDNSNYFGRLLLNKIFSPENFKSEIAYFLGYNMKREINPKKFPEQSEIIMHYVKSRKYLFNKIAIIKPRYLIGLKGKWKSKIKHNEFLDFFKTLLLEPKFIDLFDDGLFPAYSPNLIAITKKIIKDGKSKTIIEDILLPYWENNKFMLKKIFKQPKLEEDVLIGDKSTKWDEKYFIHIVGNMWLDIFNLRYSAINYNENEHFNTQKVEKLMSRVILSSSNEKDLILDPFLGSGTTISVAHKLNRKWIGIEQGNTFHTKIMPRMKQVLSGSNRGISKMVNWKGGGFFKYYNLESYDDALRNVYYEDKNVLKLTKTELYNQYIFLKDEKYLKALEIDFKAKKVKIDFNQLYKNIDIPETLSNLYGLSIEKIGKKSIKFSSGEMVSYKDLDYLKVKDLIWW